MEHSKPVSSLLAAHLFGTKDERDYMSKVPYSSVVGSLIYGMVCPRPYLVLAASVASRFMSNPGKAHWETVKWNMLYLKGISDICLVYSTDSYADGLAGYTNSDHGGDLMKRRSLTCYIFILY